MLKYFLHKTRNVQMYYFTIIVGKTQRSLVQYFHPDYEYQLETIPGIKDMIKNFK